MIQKLTINVSFWQDDRPTVQSDVARAVNKEIQKWIQTTAAPIPWIITSELTRSADGDDRVAYEVCISMNA